MYQKHEVGNDQVGGFAVAPTPIRAKAVEDILRGEALEDKVIEEAAKAAMGEARPISDIRGSAEYRRNMGGGF